MPDGQMAQAESGVLIRELSAHSNQPSASEIKWLSGLLKYPERHMLGV
jgi:hypothetical protein